MVIVATLASAVASVFAAPATTTKCETSTFWTTVDESVLDLVAPKGTRPVHVFVGCRFVDAPGAVVDVSFHAEEYRGLTVLGMRRALGQLIVAVPVGRVAALEQRRSVPTEVHVVRGGNWRPLLMEVNRIHRVSVLAGD